MLAKGYPANQAQAIAYKGMGASLANSPFNGSFATVWNQDTNTAGGQQAFVQAAFEAIFSRAPTAAEIAANVVAFQQVKTYYAATPVPETTTDARAKGEFLADFVKQMIDFSIGPNPDLPNFTQMGNAIIALASDTYIGGIPIENEPVAPGTGQSFNLLSNVEMIIEITGTAGLVTAGNFHFWA